MYRLGRNTLRTGVIPDPPGTILYQKNFEDGSIDSGGWGHQDYLTLCGSDPCYNGGIRRGLITIETTTPDQGTKRGKFFLPTDPGASPPLSSSFRVQCECLHIRKPDTGTHSWYASAFMVPTGFTPQQDGGCNILQLNYTGIAPSLNIAITNVYSGGTTGNPSVIAWIQSGQIISFSNPTDFSGLPRGAGFAARGVFTSIPGPWYLVERDTLVRDQWYEVLLHVYNSVDFDGIFEAWIRPKGGSWTQKFSYGPSDVGFCTLPYDDTHAISTGWERSSIRANFPDTNDKFGAYNGIDTVNNNIIYHDSFARATGRPAAETSFT